MSVFNTEVFSVIHSIGICTHFCRPVDHQYFYSFCLDSKRNISRSHGSWPHNNRSLPPYQGGLSCSSLSIYQKRTCRVRTTRTEARYFNQQNGERSNPDLPWNAYAARSARESTRKGAKRDVIFLIYGGIGD